MFVSATLTEQEMSDLDDGQGWYQAGDTVVVAGYTPDSPADNTMFDLSVNGVIHDNWTSYQDLPQSIRDRLA